MADDLLAQLASQQSLLQSSQGAGGKSAYLLAGILPGGAKDIDVGVGLSLKGKGLNSDKMLPLPKAQPGLFAKLLESTGCTRAQIMEGMKKCADAAPVRQINSITEITGSGMSGGFAASGRNDGGMDLG